MTIQDPPRPASAARSVPSLSDARTPAVDPHQPSDASALEVKWQGVWDDVRLIRVEPAHD